MKLIKSAPYKLAAAFSIALVALQTTSVAAMQSLRSLQHNPAKVPYVHPTAKPGQNKGLVQVENAENVPFVEIYGADAVYNNDDDDDNNNQKHGHRSQEKLAQEIQCNAKIQSHLDDLIRLVGVA